MYQKTDSNMRTNWSQWITGQKSTYILYLIRFNLNVLSTFSRNLMVYVMRYLITTIYFATVYLAYDAKEVWKQKVTNIKFKSNEVLW